MHGWQGEKMKRSLASCGICGVQWQGEKMKRSLASCGICGVQWQGEKMKRSLVSCGICGVQWQGEKMKRSLASCGICGVQWQDHPKVNHKGNFAVEFRAEHRTAPLKVWAWGVSGCFGCCFWLEALRKCSQPKGWHRVLQAQP